jgi:hypothetical protein
MPEREHTWRKFYRAAMLESDPANLDGRIAKAQADIEQRLQELGGVPSIHPQWQELQDALHNMRVLGPEGDFR